MSTEAEETNRRLNKDVMDMISALTRHLASVRDHKPAGGLSHGDNADEHGASIITLAGNNSGATFKSSSQADVAPDQDADVAPLEWATLVNSNLQAINNSVLLGTKYKSHDPGVHVDISEDLDSEEGHERASSAYESS